MQHDLLDLPNTFREYIEDDDIASTLLIFACFLICSGKPDHGIDEAKYTARTYEQDTGLG
ncbi:hypothetical protein D3C73_1637240 [compost metagenome]